MSPGGLSVAALVVLVSSGVTAWLCSSGTTVALLDHPNARSLHTRPTPRTGGLAIFGSFLLGLLIVEISGWGGVSFWNPPDPARAGIWLWIVGMTLVMGTVSFWDDRRGLPPAVRLGLHGVAAIGTVMGTGLAVPALFLPFVGTVSLGGFAVPLTVLGLVWMANLYNFMDGMDGFAGGMTVLGFGLLGYLAFAGGAPDLALAAVLIAGAAGGFLFFNVPPARIFMGDIGSVPLGFLAGNLTVLGVRDGVFDLWVPLLIFSPFVVDATVTLMRRVLRGVEIWQAHREHYYQRLVLAGWGHRKTVLAEYALMLASGATAVLYLHVTDVGRVAILAFWLLAYLMLGRGVALVESRARQQRVEV